jgi:hypothetical protein
MADVTVNGGTPVTMSVGGVNKTYYYTEQVTSPSETPVEVTLAIENLAISTDNILVEQISCYEVPRAHLYKGESNVKSSQRATCEPDNFIRETTEESVFGPFEGVAEARETNRRNVHHWSHPDGVNTTQSTFTDIHNFSACQPD